MKLDIDWLHKERKEGRRSGRTTEMLANVVGVALMAENDTDIYIVCATGSERDISHSFIEVLKAISPTTTHFLNIRGGWPSIVVPIDKNFVKIMFRNTIRDDITWNRPSVMGKKLDEFLFVDHYFEEYQEQVEFQKSNLYKEPAQYRMGRGRFGFGW